jgi:hypothetical protein
MASRGFKVQVKGVEAQEPSAEAAAAAEQALSHWCGLIYVRRTCAMATGSCAPAYTIHGAMLCIIVLRDRETEGRCTGLPQVACGYHQRRWGTGACLHRLPCLQGTSD